MLTTSPGGALCIGKGNIKIGSALTFSLPSRLTCPGASPWCLRRCYAFRYERLRPSCLDAYGRNLSLSLDADRFTETMVGTLPRGLRGLRIHVSGDFYSALYTNTWIRICQARPDIVFWSYTRAWCVQAILPSLDALRHLLVDLGGVFLGFQSCETRLARVGNPLGNEVPGPHVKGAFTRSAGVPPNTVHLTGGQVSHLSWPTGFQPVVSAADRRDALSSLTGWKPVLHVKKR